MIVIENNWLEVSISRHGAEMREVNHKKNGLSYMWTGDERYWGRVSPVLFPIVGRLKGDQYQVDWKFYSMTQHGFLRDVEFDVAEQTVDAVSFVFQSDGKFTAIYPYEFTARIHYKLENDSLLVGWEVTNESKEKMYFSIGGHPAFRIPLQEQESLEDYQLTFTQAENKTAKEYELKDSLIHEKGITNLKDLQLTASLFENDALIYSNIDQITLKSGNHGVELTMKDFPFVGIWSKYNEQDETIAPFVCIEPWYGIADMNDTTGDLKEKFGINELEHGSTFRSEYGIRFK